MATKEPGAIKKNTPAPARQSYPNYETPTAKVKTDRARERLTEAGMSKAQIATTRAWEESQRNAKTENLAIIDPNGVLNPLGNPVTRRSRTSVSTDPSKYPNGGKDCIITHNHPYNPETDGAGLGAEVGISLSGPDIRNAIREDNKEKRAVTPNYIFSIKRPANGWNANPRQVESDWDLEFKLHDGMATRYVNMYRNGELTKEEFRVRIGRVNAVAAHEATQAVAKKYGFIYTRRRR